jgi:2-oxoglutarate dehydrogenase E1 component
MTGKSRRQLGDGISDDLFGVFTGINGAYTASMLENVPTLREADDSNGAETDFEYTGLLTDPNFSYVYEPDADEKSGLSAEQGGEVVVGQDASVDQEIEAVSNNGFEGLEVEVGDPDSVRAVVADSGVSIDQVVRVERLINHIREDGHHAADIDPLGMLPREDDHLRPERFGVLPETLGASSSLLAEANDEFRPWMAKPTIGEAIAELKSAYCGTIGYEFDHIHRVEERLWLQDQVENQSAMQFMSDSQKRYHLELLTNVEGLEKYLHATFPGKRWYGLEGLDALVPLIDQIILQSAFNVKQIVMGMPHRGRLNVLAHLLEQPYESLLTGFLEGRFAHLAAMEAAGWMTDVKYHLGSRAEVDVNRDGSTDIQLRLLPNPSHLEMVSPVVLGAVRAAQDAAPEDESPHLESMALLIHGDAAFAGQGIVAEALNLVNLDGYSVGGAIHVIANNQLGFTTEPHEGYSGQYCSDIARGYEIPVVHVNAEDLEACALVAKMAVSYRLKFRKDFVIDLVGYRRHGHNENDEPRFTQPTMYERVAEHPTLREQWVKRLIAEEVVSQEEADKCVQAGFDALSAAMKKVDASGAGMKRQEPADLGLTPEPMQGEDYFEAPIDEESLIQLNEKISKVPDDFKLHPTVERVLYRRAQTLTVSKPEIDWAHAEALAIGSVIQDGVPVRLTGQDCLRGTFSQRHAVVWEYGTGRTYCPLQQVEEAKFSIFNSPLSEAGPVGFEHGYSVFSESSLVLWEAQFGDFVNNAQAIIDEIVVSAREKWGQRSNLVLLLPHGYEGQGPNHSHAHLERFLDLASSGNMRIANPTTAAQYFHLLRTQAALLSEPERARPLVVMTPKSLLRHPMAASSLNDLIEGKFRPIRKFTLSDSPPDKVKRVVLCSGKIFVDLATHPKIGDVKDIGVIVLEELYPFPDEMLSEAFRSFSNYEDVVWLQEEPRNRGAWDFVRTPIASIINTRVRYIGRPRSPSPASGSNWLHRKQQDRLIRIALKIDPDK